MSQDACLCWEWQDGSTQINPACDLFTAHVHDLVSQAVKVAVDEMNREEDDHLLYGTKGRP